MNKINKPILFFVLFLLLFSVGSVFLSDSNSLFHSNNALVCGDVDLSGSVDIDDVVFLIAYIFGGGPAPEPLGLGDVDKSGFVDISDVVYILNYIFAGGPAPNCPTIQPRIIVPEDNEVVSSPVYVAVENIGLTDFSEVKLVRIYYSVDDVNWVFLYDIGPSQQNLWEFSIELNPGFNYIMVIMESAEEGRSSPSVLIEVTE
ncbi:dockerin type I repeat-containing protein [Candidatus Micrarchaeota archaeon]|nr:dockerin type I repeat-containing protein [Candidatus Micrarchaeota archaeon]MBU2477308.1 dockerin type I repeat-containing protein [Candidatus Micrarchaeota archaeon]